MLSLLSCVYLLIIEHDYAQVLGYDKGNVQVIIMFINTLIMKGMFSTNHIHVRF